MATILKNLVQFAALAPGASLSLPHGLNDDGLPLLPDTVAVAQGAQDIEVGADDTEVTATNNGGSPATFDVLVEHWHSIERVLPPGLDALPSAPFIYDGADSILGGVVQTLAAPGALDLAAEFVDLQVDGVDAFTLADGLRAGQKIAVRCTAAANGPAGTITPANFGDGTSVLFDAVGEEATFMWTGATWRAIRVQGATINP